MTTEAFLLPANVEDGNLIYFLARLGAANDSPEITLDFQRVRFLVPGATVALLTRVHAWINEGKIVRLKGIDQCRIATYLQRMNFFDLCGVNIPEQFKRREAAGRFVEITRVGRDGVFDVGPLATTVANCIVPEATDVVDDDEKTGPYDYLEYAISELAANVVQHSRHYGFVFAQHTPSTDLVRVAIADCGVGIRESFTGSPHWFEGIDDSAAMVMALKPKVSSKSHLSGPWGGGPVNAGVGLTMLQELARQVCGAFFLISGTACQFQSRQMSLPTDKGFAGTLCAISLKRSSVKSFHRTLHDAKVKMGLLRPGLNYPGMFK